MPNIQSKVESLIPYNLKLQKSIQKMNAQECRVQRLRELAGNQARDNVGNRKELVITR